VDGGIDYFKGDVDVTVSVVTETFLMVKMGGRVLGEKNYGLTVTVLSKEWCGWVLILPSTAGGNVDQVDRSNQNNLGGGGGILME
jgi:hypothetical protein